MNNQRGSITVFFLFMLAILMGAISLSMYSGQIVEKRIQTQNAADAAAMAVATHASQGLNMIAANNMAIASSIHVAGSLQILGLYISIVRLFSYTYIDFILDELRQLWDGSSKFQEVLDKCAIFGGLFMRAASGMTDFNSLIAGNWLYFGTLRGMEVGLLNRPGAIVVPLQRRLQGLPTPLMQYQGLRQMRPEDTICHTIYSSKATDAKSRHNPITWLLGSSESAVDTIPVLSSIQEMATWINDWINRMHEILPVHFGFSQCGSGLVSPLIALLYKLYKDMPKLLESVRQIITGDWDSWVSEAKPKDPDLVDILKDQGKCWGVLIGTICQPPLGVGSPTDGHLPGVVWEGMKQPKKLQVLVEIASDNMGNSGLSAGFAAMLTKMAKEINDRDPGACFPYQDKNGIDKCWGVTNRRWLCPAIMAGLVYLDFPPVVTDIPPANWVKDAHRHGVDTQIDCAEFRDFVAPALHNPDEKKLAEQRMPDGINIVEWAKQAYTWSHQKNYGLPQIFQDRFQTLTNALRSQGNLPSGTMPKPGEMNNMRALQEEAANAYKPDENNAQPERVEGLGLLLIDGDAQHNAVPWFTARTEFAVAVAAAIHTKPQACDDSLKIEVQDPSDPTKKITVCEQQPLSLFGAALDKKTYEGALDQNLANAGLSELTERGDLKQDWRRTQLMMAQAKTLYEGLDTDPEPGTQIQQLLWPAWRPRPVPNTLMTDIFKVFRSKKTDTQTVSNAEAISTVVKD